MLRSKSNVKVEKFKCYCCTLNSLNACFSNKFNFSLFFSSNCFELFQVRQEDARQQIDENLKMI